MSASAAPPASPPPATHRPARSNFFPIIISFLRQFPVMGTILNLPVVRTVVDRLGGDILPVYRGSD